VPIWRHAVNETLEKAHVNEDVRTHIQVLLELPAISLKHLEDSLKRAEDSLKRAEDSLKLADDSLKDTRKRADDSLKDSRKYLEDSLKRRRARRKTLPL
jgi:hypothetical protein